MEMRSNHLEIDSSNLAINYSYLEVDSSHQVLNCSH